MTGQWDGIHPAGLAILIAALAIALILRKGFCGWICPVGFLSNLTERLGKPIRFFDNAPPWIDYPLLSLKYILLEFKDATGSRKTVLRFRSNLHASLIPIPGTRLHTLY